jgi:hypothetical protein
MGIDENLDDTLNVRMSELGLLGWMGYLGSHKDFFPTHLNHPNNPSSDIRTFTWASTTRLLLSSILFP